MYTWWLNVVAGCRKALVGNGLLLCTNRLTKCSPSRLRAPFLGTFAIMTLIIIVVNNQVD